MRHRSQEKRKHVYFTDFTDRYVLHQLGVDICQLEVQLLVCGDHRAVVRYELQQRVDVVSPAAERELLQHVAEHALHIGGRRLAQELDDPSI